jgi:hypothetical protein
MAPPIFWSKFWARKADMPARHWGLALCHADLLSKSTPFLKFSPERAISVLPTHMKREIDV